MGEWIEASNTYKRQHGMLLRQEETDEIREKRFVETLKHRHLSTNTERWLKVHLKRNFKTIFPDFKLVGFEQSVYGVFSHDSIGLVDIIIKKGNKYLIVEVKHDDNNCISNFWSSLKVLGYAEAFRIYRNLNHNAVVPVVMVDKKFITTDTLPILHKYKLGYIAFYRNENHEYEFEYSIP